MKKFSVLCLLALSLGFCTTYDDINFERMSEAELLEYNRGRALGQMIVCSEDQRTMSRVRRRRCATIDQMYGSVEQAEKIGVLDSSARTSL